MLDKKKQKEKKTINSVWRERGGGGPKERKERKTVKMDGLSNKRKSREKMGVGHVGN